MEQQLTGGVKLLNGFLRLIVACLVVIIIALPLAFILDLLGLI